MTTQELHGIAHELKFWQGFVKTDRFIKGWVANCITPELNHQVYDFIHGMLTQSPDRNAVKIMDVGSGVVSILNGLVPQANLTVVDPLGELYELVFDYKKYGIKPPLPIPAEELDYSDAFDIVHISNALDHCQDPVVSYHHLYNAVKQGGFLIIQGFENEADYEQWKGFHQFNIELQEDSRSLFIQSKGEDPVQISNAHFCKLIPLDNGKSWFIFIVKK